jgi:hypothetical protein
VVAVLKLRVRQSIQRRGAGLGARRSGEWRGHICQAWQSVVAHVALHFWRAALESGTDFVHIAVGDPACAVRSAPMPLAWGFSLCGVSRTKPSFWKTIPKRIKRFHGDQSSASNLHCFQRASSEQPVKRGLAHVQIIFRLIRCHAAFDRGGRLVCQSYLHDSPCVDWRCHAIWRGFRMEKSDTLSGLKVSGSARMPDLLPFAYPARYRAALVFRITDFHFSAFYDLFDSSFRAV